MKSLGKNVVIMGAGVFGTETGICLAKDGYKVTVLTSGKGIWPFHDWAGSPKIPKLGTGRKE